jgi:hypothetical protein
VERPLVTICPFFATLPLLGSACSQVSLVARSESRAARFLMCRGGERIWHFRREKRRSLPIEFRSLISFRACPNTLSTDPNLSIFLFTTLLSWSNEGCINSARQKAMLYFFPGVTLCAGRLNRREISHFQMKFTRSENFIRPSGKGVDL